MLDNNKFCDTKDLVNAVQAMIVRAKTTNSEIIYFIESGGLVLKDIFMSIKDGYGFNDSNIVSSKITALSKIPLNYQIKGLLTKNEIDSKINVDQLEKIRRVVEMNKFVNQKEIADLFFDEKPLEKSLGDIIDILTPLGDILPNIDHPNNDFLQNNLIFIQTKEKLLKQRIKALPDINHDIRPILNILLVNTSFAKKINGRKIYVMDEATSRGRALWSIEIILKAFDPSAVWKIGVIYSTAPIKSNEYIDYIFSSTKPPLFTNRSDILGVIVAKDEQAGFRRYETDSLINDLKNTEFDDLSLNENLQIIYKHIESISFEFDTPSSLSVDQKLKLINFWINCNNKEHFEECLNLNLISCAGIIEQVSFYLCAPNPFADIRERESFKEESCRFLEQLQETLNNKKSANEFNDIKEKLIAIRKELALNELISWQNNRKEFLQKINQFISVI
ncbi:hypothetical protein M0P48_05630 [Candidatus Gracilibacteria bacterium]|jgi:hypothetical protein|nr:hypothetical protein [Candidatus Gracilibacteria bacterium]